MNEIEAIERAIERLMMLSRNTMRSINNGLSEEFGMTQHFTETNDALDVAISALCAKAERMKGCGICHDQTATITGFRYWKTNTAVMEQSFGAAFCPKCGRRLEDKP